MSHSTATPPLFRAPELALIFITIIWGGTFLAVQFALTSTTPMFFVGCRFAAATIATAFISFKALKAITKYDVFAGFLIGISIMIGYGAQTIGLQEITSSESAFLTALYVPIVPLLQWVVFKRAPKLLTWIGVTCAFVGLVLLTGNGIGSLSFNRGQIYTIICAFAVAGEIILIGYFAGKVNIRNVTVMQLFFASVLSFLYMPAAGETALPAFSWIWFGMAIGLGCATALIQLTMNWAQRSVDPTRATLIYAGEPVWAGIFGRIAGERLAPLALLGAGLVVIGVIISQIRIKSRDMIKSKK